MLIIGPWAYNRDIYPIKSPWASIRLQFHGKFWVSFRLQALGFCTGNPGMKGNLNFVRGRSCGRVRACVRGRGSDHVRVSDRVPAVFLPLFVSLYVFVAVSMSMHVCVRVTSCIGGHVRSWTCPWHCLCPSPYPCPWLLLMTTSSLWPWVCQCQGLCSCPGPFVLYGVRVRVLCRAHVYVRVHDSKHIRVHVITWK